MPDVTRRPHREEDPIGLDKYLVPIYIGSRVEHQDKWEGVVIRKSAGDSMMVLWKLTSDDDGIEYQVITDELRVIPDTVENVPGSVLSDIEGLDKATDKLVESIDDGQSYAAIDKDDVEMILDRISDARSGLLYLVQKYNEEKQKQNS